MKKMNSYVWTGTLTGFILLSLSFLMMPAAYDQQAVSSMLRILSGLFFWSGILLGYGCLFLERKVPYEINRKFSNGFFERGSKILLSLLVFSAAVLMFLLHSGQQAELCFVLISILVLSFNLLLLLNRLKKRTFYKNSERRNEEYENAQA